MANLKISQLSPGAPAVATDLIPIDRAGANFSLQVSDVAAVSAPPIATAGQGYFVGPGLFNIFGVSVAAAVLVGASGTQVRAFQFYLPAAITIGHVSINVVSGTSTGGTATVGIYNAAGTTKLFDSGTISINATAVVTQAAAAFQTPAGGPLTLLPGVYWLAQNASVTSGFTVAVFTSETTVAAALNNVSPRAIIAGNTAAAGVLPANLGVGTGSAITTSQPIVAVFEP